MIAKENPQYVVMAHTYQVRDFAPKVAARLGREVVGDCIRYAANAGKLTLTRRIFLGKLDADVTIGGDAPYFVTFQSGAFRGDNAEKGKRGSRNAGSQCQRTANGCRTAVSGSESVG